MDFKLSQEHLMARDLFRSFAQNSDIKEVKFSQFAQRRISVFAGRKPRSTFTTRVKRITPS